MRELALLLLASAALAAPPSASDRAARESALSLASGDVARALAEAHAAVTADAKNPRALEQLARASNAALDFPNAEAAATRALAFEAATPGLLCLRSEARAGRGDFEDALVDADLAFALDPRAACGIVRRAIAKEGLGRPDEEALEDYRGAAALDPALAPLRDAAEKRLAPRARPRRRLGFLVGLLALAAFGGWALGVYRGEEAAEPKRPEKEEAARLTALEGLRMLNDSADAASGPEKTLLLARSLRERLTGRLPVGSDAFFERALNPDPARRFRNGAELARAFRSLVQPSVE